MGDLTGQTLAGQYFLRELIGSGGMADVYQTWDSVRNVSMAVKVLKSDKLRDHRFVKMFEQEAHMLSELKHPNIVRLYELRSSDSETYIVMDFVPGKNLRDTVLGRNSPYTVEQAGNILTPVCAALNFAHKQFNIVHCDVKPANILLHEDGHVLLTDFGIARLATVVMGGGTPPYMAPEQFAGDHVDARTDVYALGITLYEMLTGGTLPFTGRPGRTTEDFAKAHMTQPVPPLRALNDKVPVEVEDVIMQALGKTKEQRFPTAMDLMNAYMAALSGHSLPASSGAEQAATRFETLPPPSSQAASPDSQRVFRSDQHARGHLPAEEPQLGDPQPPRQEQVEYQPQSVQSAHAPLPPRRAQQRDMGIGEPHLIGVLGELAGMVIVIPPGTMEIGRSTQNHLRLRQGSVSRKHATITREPDGVYLDSLAGTGLTFVNGHPINSTILLVQGTVIQMGNYEMFEFRER